MIDKQLNIAIKAIDDLVSNVRCEGLHHPKKWQHEIGGVCFAEYNIQRQWYLIKEYLNEVVDSDLE